MISLALAGCSPDRESRDREAHAGRGRGASPSPRLVAWLVKRVREREFSGAQALPGLLAPRGVKA